MGYFLKSLLTNSGINPLVLGFAGFLAAVFINTLLLYFIYLGIIAYSSKFFAVIICGAILFLIASYAFPVFTGRGSIQIFIGTMLIGAVIFAIIGENDLRNYHSDFEFKKAQKAREKAVRNILTGEAFEEDAKTSYKIKKTIKGILLGEREDREGLTIFKFRLEGDTPGVYNGKIIWVPLGMIQELPKKQSAQTSAVQEGNLEKRTVKNQPGVVVLTPEEIIARNEHRAFRGKTFIVLPDHLNLKVHSRMVLLEDLVIETDNPENSTALFFGGQRGFIGRGQTVRVPKGTVFRFGGTGPRVYIVSKGEHKIVSSLKLKKI